MQFTRARVSCTRMLRQSIGCVALLPCAFEKNEFGNMAGAGFGNGNKMAIYVDLFLKIIVCCLLYLDF